MINGERLMINFLVFAGAKKYFIQCILLNILIAFSFISLGARVK